MTAIVFSLIIPCYNEVENLPLLLERCKLLTLRTDIEVILVDNGSTDATQQLLSNLLPIYPGCRAVRVEKNLGYGHGILSGLKSAKGDVLAWTHADLQTDPADILCGLSMFEKHGLDTFVKGRRYGRPFFDTLFTVGMSIFESLLLRIPMWDINAQPTIFSRNFFESWIAPPNDFSLDLFAYYQAKQKKLRIQRFSVKFSQRAHGVSHWNINWTSKWKFIRRTISFSMNLKRNIT
jgi:glycosyltransferase involved in cell wall biosynthesis